MVILFQVGNLRFPETFQLICSLIPIYRSDMQGGLPHRPVFRGIISLTYTHPGENVFSFTLPQERHDD